MSVNGVEIKGVQHGRLALGARAVLVVFCLAVAALDRQPRQAVAGALVIVIAALVGHLPARLPPLRRLLPTVEACIAALAVIVPPVDRTLLLPYLLAPAFAAGLLQGVQPAVTAVGMAALVLLVGHTLSGNGGALRDFAPTASEWVLLALALGLLAAWIRRLVDEAGRDDGVNESYEAAYRLISQLRTVARQLSEGLDAVSLARGLLQALRDHVPYDTAAVFVRSEGGVLVPLAVEGSRGSEPDWDTSLSSDTAFAEVWATQRPLAFDHGLGRAGGGARGVSGAVLPLRIGSRTFGLVGLESAATHPPAGAGLDAARRVVDRAALRLETALLFSEVRTIATAEERRRLAREIHDGIAQELASLGYAVDDLLARLAGTDSEPALRSLRGELTRLVSELRLSIFDLRSEVQDDIGLGTALSDYVRRVGAGSAFAIHLVLDEAARRLPIAAEAELLRIAQEAITNARKHAGADHLWITLTVDPPHARLRIEDDGKGLGPGRLDSFGLEVMKERAARLGATLYIGNREPRGTLVDVRLGERPATAKQSATAAGVPSPQSAPPDNDLEEASDVRHRAAR